MRRAAAAVVVVALVAAVWLASRDRDDAEPPATADVPGQTETVTRTRTARPTATAPGDGDPTARPSSRPPYAIPIPPIAEAVHGRLVYSLLSAAVTPLDARTSQLRLTIRFSNEGRYDANAWDASFRLLADGQTLVPTSGLNEVVSGNAQIDRAVTFTMPADTRRVILRILDPEAELPLDVTPTGTSAPGNRAGSDEEPSRAVTRALIAEPRTIVRTSDGTITVQQASSRRFVNALRVRFSVRVTNTGRYPAGFPQLRLAAGGRVIAPLESPALVVLPDSDADGDVDFDAAPDATRAVLRVTIGDRTEELPLELQ